MLRVVACCYVVLRVGWCGGGGGGGGGVSVGLWVLFLFVVLALKSSLCVLSKRSRVCRQNARVT